MVYPEYNMVQKLAEKHNTIPLTLEIYSDIATPISVLRKLNTLYDCCFLLESVEGGERWGRYSFLGYDPFIRVSYKDGLARIRHYGKEEYETTEETSNPYDILRGIQKDFSASKIDGLPPFTGGFVGYFSYSMINSVEPKLKIWSGSFNDYDVMLFDKVIAFDHKKQKIFIIKNISTKNLNADYEAASARLDKIAEMIKESLLGNSQSSSLASPFSATSCMHQGIEFTSSLTKEEFCTIVEKTKEYIRKGEISQAVISIQYLTNYKGSLLDAYRVLRTTNPSPYMVYMNIYGDEIICSSPETLVGLSDGRLTTFPVAGSRPRGKTAEEDMALEKELLADEKELSEHNMLVDLGKYDLEGISKAGSVEITKYMMIHRYSKIMHICSQVESDILPSKDAFSAIEAVLPAGTLSGSPRIRACEIIEDLEPKPRGIYGGALGYIDFAGNADTCIAIRMAVKKDGKVYVQAGSGIVAQSVAETEFEEAENKARALIDAVKIAGEI